MAATRTIVLLRHAKSAWGLDVPDHERPLSKRGKRDSIAVAHQLLHDDLHLDLVWCSTAERSRDTWRRIAKAGVQADDVAYDDHLYEAVAHELVKVLRKTPDEAGTVLMIGHSPGIPDLVERLAPRHGHRELWARMDTKYPTSGLATLSYRGDWAELAKQSAELVDFVVPRGRKSEGG